MHTAHILIFLAGLLAIVSIWAGAFASRLKAPLLLVFLLLGMLAGEDGAGIAFSDMGTAYLLGSLALTVILFEGGIKTHRSMLGLALFPASLLATLGVVISAAGIAYAATWFGLSWAQALLLGAAVAPTDAAAVGTLLRQGGIRLPERVGAILELESGLNDPISVVLMVLGVDLILHPGLLTPGHALLLVAQEMLGGAAIGIGGGFLLLWLLRQLRAEAGIYPVLALGGAMAIFGGAQTLETSGFLAVYLAGFIVGNYGHEQRQAVTAFFEAFSWAAQIGLFVLLGLLVTPHELLALIRPALFVAGLLIAVARPVASFICLLPFRMPMRQIGFISWVGLRGAVPIYLTLIPVLSGLPRANVLFELVFVVVVMSLVVQGWTAGPAARLAGFAEGEHKAGI
jgi:cell volume regulation protein A